MNKKQLFSALVKAGKEEAERSPTLLRTLETFPKLKREDQIKAMNHALAHCSPAQFETAFGFVLGMLPENFRQCVSVLSISHE